MASRGGSNQVRAFLQDSGSRRQGRGLFALVGEVWGELTKVNWPSREDTTRLSILVIVVAIVAGIFLGLWDFGFTQLVDRVLI
jgi:preprotein translocase SecE subunit